jgi:hypothetical protein
MTIIFLVISGGCLAYFFMGMSRAIVGYKENSTAKAKGGILAIIISLAVLAVIIYIYYRWIWLL